MQIGFDYIGVGVCAVCHDGKGRVLLNLRSENCRDEWHKWDNCGGAMKLGESGEECVKRELREEYGCRPIKCQYGGIIEMKRQNGEKINHWLILAYLVQIDPNEAKNNELHKFEQVKWFERHELPQNRHSFFDQDWAAVQDEWSKFYSSHSSMDRTAAS